jgi:hypothetical protein
MFLFWLILTVEVNCCCLLKVILYLSYRWLNCDWRFLIVMLKRFCLQNGVMQTHDEETRKFFKHSSVNCVLSPRYASSKLSIFRQQACIVFHLLYHHFLHQF